MINNSELTRRITGHGCEKKIWRWKQGKVFGVNKHKHKHKEIK